MKPSRMRSYTNYPGLCQRNYECGPALCQRHYEGCTALRQRNYEDCPLVNKPMSFTWDASIIFVIISLVNTFIKNSRSTAGRFEADRFARAWTMLKASHRSESYDRLQNVKLARLKDANLRTELPDDDDGVSSAIPTKCYELPWREERWRRGTLAWHVLDWPCLPSISTSFYFWKKVS